MATMSINTSQITPGSTVACRFCSSIFKTWLKRSIAKSTPPLIGNAPPLKPVPAPGVTGIKCQYKATIAAETSGTVAGFCPPLRDNSSGPQFRRGCTLAYHHAG